MVCDTQTDICDASPHRQLPTIETSVQRSCQRDVLAVCRARRDETGDVRVADLPQRTDAFRASHEHALLRRHQGMHAIIPSQYTG